MRIAIFFGNVIAASRESGLGIGQLLDIFRRRGAEGLEICVGEYLEYGEELESALRNGYEITSVYNEYSFSNGSLDPDEVIRHIHTAARLRCPRALIIPGFYTDPGNRELHEREKENFLTCIGTAAKMCRDAGIAPLLENYDHWRSPVCRFSDVLWFAENIPELAVTLDVGNLLYAGEKVPDAVSCIAERERRLGRGLLENVHCKDRTDAENGYGRTDTMDGRRVYPAVLGEGLVDYRWLTGKLKERGYGGFLVVENFAISNYVDFMQRSIDNISLMIGKKQ